MESIKIIGLTGALQSGKDTTYQAIKEVAAEKGIDVRHLSFADPMKMAMMELFGGEPKNYFGSDKDKNEPMEYWQSKLGDNFRTYRRAMQWFGTELCRLHIHPDFWVFVAEKRIRAVRDTIEAEISRVIGVESRPILFVAADVRINNEAQFVREYGGPVALIQRADGGLSADAEVSTHASEAGVSRTLLTHDFVCRLGEHRAIAVQLLEYLGLVPKQTKCSAPT